MVMCKTILLLMCLLASATTQTDQELKLQLRGSDDDHQGIVVVSEDSEEGVVCDDGAGHNTVMAICRMLGYEYGTFVSSSRFKELDLEFMGTWLRCTEYASDVFTDCEVTLYEEADIPCHSGQAVAVSCSNEILEGNMDVRYKVNKKKTMAKVLLSPEIRKYGVEVNVNMFNSKAMLLNRASATEYASVATLKYTKKKKKSVYVGKVTNLQDVDCAVGVLVIDSQPQIVKIMGCDDEKVTEDMIQEELQELWKDSDEDSDDS